MVGAVGFLWLHSAGEIPEMDLARSLCGSRVLPAALALLSEVCLKHKNEKLVELSVVRWEVGKSSCLVFCRPGGMGHKLASQPMVWWGNVPDGSQVL